MNRIKIQITIRDVYFDNISYSQVKFTNIIWWAKDGHWYRLVTNCDFSWRIVDDKHWVG